MNQKEANEQAQFRAHQAQQLTTSAQGPSVVNEIHSCNQKTIELLESQLKEREAEIRGLKDEIEKWKFNCNALLKEYGFMQKGK